MYSGPPRWLFGRTFGHCHHETSLHQKRRFDAARFFQFIVHLERNWCRFDGHVGILGEPFWNPGGGILEEEFWKGNPGGGILEKESWRNPGGGIPKEGPRGRILEEESWRRNFGKGILKEEA